MNPGILISAILLILLSNGTALGNEATQSLLNELIQPHSALTNKVSQESPQTEETVLFSLKELKDSTIQLNDLLLPDDEPAADIPLALNEKVEYFLNYFQTKGRTTFSRWLTRSTRYIPMMKEILKKEGLPDELVYVAMIESGFQLHARSVANAVGPWQFMSATGKRYSLRINQWIDERKDPVKATMAAAMYLKDLYGMFNNDWYLAAAGYNAGENKIFRAIDKYATNDFWELSKGSYLKRETKEYVPKLLAAAIIAKDPAHYGFLETATLPVIEYDTVTVKSATDLELAASLTGTTYQTIKQLNPALRHWCTPPDYPEYELNIPKGTKTAFLQGISSIPDEKRFTEKNLFMHYTASRKDNLKKIASRFGITTKELADLNGFSHKQRIAGRKLIVPAKQPVSLAASTRNRPDSISQTTNHYYTVRSGDTLYSLARRFKVSTKLLAAWNNIKEAFILQPGKRLIVAKSDKSASGKS